MALRPLFRDGKPMFAEVPGDFGPVNSLLFVDDPCDCPVCPPPGPTCDNACGSPVPSVSVKWYQTGGIGIFGECLVYDPIPQVYPIYRTDGCSNQWGDDVGSKVTAGYDPDTDTTHICYFNGTTTSCITVSGNHCNSPACEIPYPGSYCEIHHPPDGEEYYVIT